MRGYPPSVQRFQPGEISFDIAHDLLIEPNQSYFRETNLPSLLCSLLFFDPKVQPDQGVPQEFALQFWNEDKTINAGLILEEIGLLLGSKGAGVGYSGLSLLNLVCEQTASSAAP